MHGAETIRLPNTTLNATDRDTPQLMLVIVIRENVKHGILLVELPNGTRIDSAVTARIPLVTALSGRVFYEHDDTENFADEFTYIITDGLNDSEERTCRFEITPVDDLAPEVIVRALQVGNDGQHRAEVQAARPSSLS